MQTGQQTEVVSTLREIGFLGGYHFPVDTTMDTQAVQDLHVGYISGLVETVLHARGWDAGRRARNLAPIPSSKP